VPYPDPQTFRALVKLGAELRQIHLLESPSLDNAITTYPNDGDNIVTRKISKNDFEIVGGVDKSGISRDLQENVDVDLSTRITDADIVVDKSIATGRVWINDQQYFDGVPVVAWEFYIGGYQPAPKWLKDRHGRKLNFEDIRHYQKVIVALTETHRIMQTIDSIWHPVD